MAIRGSDSLKRKKKDKTLDQELFPVLKKVLNKASQAQAVGLRLGWYDGFDRTCKKAGEIVGLSVERVRQLETLARHKARRRHWELPRLAQALTLARRMAPCSAYDLYNALLQRGLIGNGDWKPSMLVTAAEFFQIAHGLTVRSMDSGKQYLAGPRSSDALPALTMKHARALIRASGAADIRELFRRLSADSTTRVYLRDVRVIVDATASPIWLDRQKQWVFFSDEGTSHHSNRVLSNVRRLLSVARRLSIDEVYAALQCLPARRDPLCPKPIMLALCSCVPWLRIDGSSVAADYQLNYESELSGADLMMVRLLKRAEGVMDLKTFRDSVSRAGFTTASLTHLRRNPLFVIVDRAGSIALRGVKFRTVEDVKGRRASRRPTGAKVGQAGNAIARRTQPGPQE